MNTSLPNYLRGRKARLAAFAAAVLMCTSTSVLAQTQKGDKNAASVGVTNTAIVLGTSTALSGPNAATGGVGKGQRAYYEYINAAQGGVIMADGKKRKIKFVMYDDALEPARALQYARRMVENDHVFAAVGGTGTSAQLAAEPYFNNNGVPHVFLSTGNPSWGTQAAKYPWTMGLWPSYSTEASIYAGYIKQNKPDAKIAIIGDDSGGPLFTNAFVTEAKKLGLNIVSREEYANSDASVIAKFDQMANSGADVLVDASTTKFTVQGLRHMAEIGWHPVHIIWNVSSGIGSVLNVAGAAASKGILSGRWFKDPSDPAYASDEDVKTYLQAIAKFDKSISPEDSNAVMGWIAGAAMVESLKQAQPNREDLMRVVRSLGHVEVPLLLKGITLTTSAQDPFPVESMQMAQFDGQRYVNVGSLISYEGKTPKN
jgi:branched-chain amino acid transport system substrate-binding protein